MSLSSSSSGGSGSLVTGDAVTSAPTPTPTPSAASTSALGDDTSSPSASATAALSTLTSCVRSIVTSDLPYARCVMNSGLFALNETQPTNLRTQLRNTSTTEGMLLAYLRTQLTTDEIQQSSIGVCRLQCTAPKFHASSSCCDATARLRACQLTNSSPDPSLVSCKQSLDNSFKFSNQECSALTKQDAAMIGVLGVAVAAVAASACFMFYKRRKLDKEARGPHGDVEKPAPEDQDTPLAGWLRQIGILVWKNLVLRARRPVAFFFEQIVPLFFVCALVVLANLDKIFGRNGRSRYRSADEAASILDDRLLCVNIDAVTADDLGSPSGTMRSFYASGQSVVGLFFLLSFIKFVSSMTASMVHEKEIKMREMMKIMGVSNGALLVSWSVTNTLLSLPIVFVLSALLKFGNVFPTTPYATVVFVFWSLTVATVAFAYALAPWFRKSRTAAIFSVLLWLLLFFPFFDVQPKLDGEKYGGALAPPTAFALAIDRLLREAQLGTGFAYSMTAAASTTAFNGVPTAETMSLFMLLDSLLLLMLGWYFEQVLPQQFGVRKPWNFLFKLEYWRSHHSKFKMTIASSPNVIQSPSLYALGSPQLAANAYAANASPAMLIQDTPMVLNIADDRRSAAAPVVEPVSADLVLQEHTGSSLQLRGLTKTFKLEDGEQKIAVDHLTLTFYSGQITSLLGHNGAGKTTTISMLTGLYPPSSGDAVLFGHSLQHESDAFRRIMGVCPQHDVLFPDLTVEEHIKFFATIKGIRGRDRIKGMITTLVEEVGLSGSRRVLAKNLSGGQKRKLSVALALTGNSKLVFFDEPTSGMDPYSRRFTWNMLRKQREGRVIVLTTHFMDEADVLGDRIAIMVDGKLRCIGSSLFLKNRFGAGYNLTMIKSSDGVFQLETIETFLATHLGLGQAKLAGESGSEVVYTLPTRASDQFPGLFDALDNEMSTLGVRNYGISVTTLEDVFLRIANDRDNDPDHAHGVPAPRTVAVEKDSQSFSTSMSPPAFATQVKAQLQKRWWISKRDKKSLVNAVGIPLLLLIIMAAIPEIQVASFLPDYATSFASQAQQDACPAANITENLLTPRTMSWCMEYGYGFCSLGLVDCDANTCCDATNYQSPFYACATCPVPVGQDVATDPCYSSRCMRRNGAKLQVALNAFIVAMIVMLAFAFVPAAIIAFVVREKDPNQDSKALQWISGMSLPAYWTSNYIHDIGIIFWSVLVTVIAAPVSRRALAGTEEVFALVLLVVAHALSIIPMTYLYSRRFTKHANAQTSMLVFALSSGGLLSIFSFLCRVVDFNMSRSLTLSGLDRDYLRWIFMLFPGYAINNGIYEIATRKITRGSLYGGWRNANPHSSFFGLFRGFGKDLRCQACWNRNIPGCCVRGALDFDVSMAPIVYMLLEAVVFAFLVFRLETRVAQAGSRKSEMSRETMLLPQKFDDQVEPEDEDVADERVRLDRLQDVCSTDDAVVIRRLQHQYPDGRRALHNLSLAIPTGECFGYLGVNGAGKSTTIKILTRQVTPTAGSIAVAGRDLGDSATDSKGVIGYCPQFDALHDLLTVEEELTLYARIKGIREDRVSTEVEDKILQLGLDEYRSKLTRGLSGGNKRKVSTAIALLGSPPIVILDEPSTGMDPSSRRKMWNVIASTCAVNKTSVILTTHSMEECEALCSRVGILVQGRLQCLGSVQHLRHKFGRGYTVDVKIQSEPKRDEVGALQQQVLQILGADDDQDDLDESQVVRLCDALGDTNRSQQLVESGAEWWSRAKDDDAHTRRMAVEHFCAWWIVQDHLDALLTFFPERFPGSSLVEQHGDHLRFHVPKQPADHAAGVLRPKIIFEALEGGRKRLHIQEYSVSDTSLEHIFNRMADEGAHHQRADGLSTRRSEV